MTSKNNPKPPRKFNKPNGEGRSSTSSSGSSSSHQGRRPGPRPGGGGGRSSGYYAPEPSIKQITQKIKAMLKPWENEESIMVLPTMAELVKKLGCSQVNILNSLLYIRGEGYRYVYSGIHEAIFIIRAENILTFFPPATSGDEDERATV